MSVTRAALGLALWGGCGGDPSPRSVPRGEAAAAPTAATTPSPPQDPPPAPPVLFDADPAHPFNELHHLLFARRVQGSRATCLDAHDCLARTVPEIAGAAQPATIELGGDEPIAFIGAAVDFLDQPQRAAEIEAMVAKATQVAPQTSDVARVLMQQDLWERHDAIEHALRGVEPAPGGNLRTIQRALVRLIAAVSLSPERLRAIPSNLDAARAAFPELLPASSGDWLELRARANERVGTPLVAGTRHAELAGNRLVFRAFVRPPDDARDPAWLDDMIRASPERPWPPGTRMALVATPLAIAADGELVELPLLLLAELRLVPPDDTVTALADVGVDVLEARRAWLTHARPGGAGGIERLARDAEIPLGATCAPQPSSRIPLAAACVLCHPGAGARLTGPMTHGTTVIELEPDADGAARRVIEAKRRDPSWQRLLEALAAAP